MRLTDLYLDGFGHFHEQSFGPVATRVTVFYGPNEAGKSTLLAFVRAVLFGFPTQHRRHYPPLSGGRHGGRARLTDDAGEVYTLERYAGARGGTVSVRTDSGEILDATAILPSLTGNATPDLFRNVFAFSLDELQNEGLMNDSGVANRIYGAGLGVSRLHELSQALYKGKRELFLPTGQQQKIAVCLAELERVDGQLSAIEDNASEYGRLTARKSEINTELEYADSEIDRFNLKRAEVDRLLDGWDDWLAMSECDARLRGLPSYESFPDNPLARLDGLEAQARQAKEDFEEAATQLRRSEEVASADVPHEDLLYDRDEVETIRRGRGSFDDSVKDLPDRRAELGSLESELTDRLRDLGPDWDEARLGEFDTSLSLRQEVERAKESQTGNLDAVRRAEQRVEQEQRALVDCETAAQEAQDRMPVSPPTLDANGLDARQSALRAARGRLNEYERARQSHENLLGQLNALTAGQESSVATPTASTLMLPAILAVLGAAMIVAGVFLGDSALVLGIIGGLAFLAASGYLLMRNRTAPVSTSNPMAEVLSSQVSDAEGSEASALLLLVEAASPLNIDGDPTTAALDTTEAGLERARVALTTWKDAQERLDEAKRRLQSQEKRLESANVSLAETTRTAAEFQGEWQGWLEGHGLPGSFAPDTVVEFLGRVETTRVKAEQVRDNRRRVAAIEYDIQQFREKVEPLARRHQVSLDPEDSAKLASAADELIRRLDAAQTAYDSRARAREQAEEDGQHLESRARRLESADNELASLLTAGGTDDAEEFRRRARQEQEREALAGQSDEHRRGLERLSGPGDRYDAFCRELEGAEPDRMREESNRLVETLGDIDAQRNSLREERGRTDSELEQLVSEEESSALRARRYTLVEQLQEHAREWSRLTIAEALLEKTRHKFERERQPSVVQHAQDFFSRVTGQRYSRLFSPVGEQNGQQTITVIDGSGASKQPNELSRGTREQLYLALRFGLIREFGEHAERLPVVVDEALVNFDPDRARLAARAFAELAETNQVLVFTCHPTTADMFADVAGAQVIDISR